MSNLVRIKINFPALVAHLSREEGRALPTEDVVRWLHDAGFTRDDPYWTVDEADLGHLEPNEVLEIAPLDEPAR